MGIKEFGLVILLTGMFLAGLWSGLYIAKQRPVEAAKPTIIVRPDQGPHNPFKEDSPNEQK